MHEQVRQHGRYRRTLRVPRSRAWMVPSGSCKRRFQPPLHIQHYPPPLVRRVGLDRLDHQVMIDGIEELLDIQIQHPVLLLAPQRHFASASSAPRRGRYPYESSWKIDSVRASSASAATVCATRSATVRTPRILTPPPCGLGISTARTGAGNTSLTTSGSRSYRGYPSDRTRIPARDCLSTPGAPLFALTLFHASHTSCFGITNGFSCDPDLLTCLLPGHTARLLMRTNPDAPAPSLRSYARSLSHYYGPVRQQVPRRYSAPHSFRRSARSLSHPAEAGRSIGTRLPAFHAKAADRARAAFMPGTTWPVNGYPPDLSRSYWDAPVPMPLSWSRHVISGSLTLAFPIPA